MKKAQIRFYRTLYKLARFTLQMDEIIYSKIKQKYDSLSPWGTWNVD